MRILFDITHPAHVHFFKNSISELRQQNHDLLVTARDKDLTIDLLNRHEIQHQSLGRASEGLPGLCGELFKRTRRLVDVVRTFKPDVMAAIGGVFVAQAGLRTRVPSLVFYDTENATLSNLLTFPFCTSVLTPAAYEGWVPKKKHVSYRGYHELAYTHPQRFTPDSERLEAFGLSQSEPFVVVRLVSWGSSHDTTDHGFVAAKEAVEVLERYARVVISSEAPLPRELQSYELRGPVEDVHHVLAFAQLFIGESATMASECATLGTPAIFLSTSARGYTNELERRYELCFSFHDRSRGQAQALEKAVELLSASDIKGIWQERRQRMLDDTVDVTSLVLRQLKTYGN